RRGIARSRDMAWIGRDADDRIRPGAEPGLAGVHSSTGIDVVAGGAVGGGGIGALPRRGIAGAGDVAWVARGASDGARTGAGARLTRIRLMTPVGAGAGRAVLYGWIRAGSRIRVAGACDVAWVHRRACHGIGAGADPRLARVRSEAPART